MSVVLGLTGSIGMGKSTTAGFFREAGIPVWDADSTVHRLYDKGGAAVSLIAELHPSAITDGAVDRGALRRWIASDPTALERLEAVVHPLVAEDRARFLSRHEGDALVVLDIPLLFESGMETACDATLVVSAPAALQRQRVLARPGMTDAHLDLILSKQMPDAQKRARADHVILTMTTEQTKADVQALIERLVERGSDA